MATSESTQIESTQDELLELLKQHQRLGTQILDCGNLPIEVADAIGGSNRAATQLFQQVKRENMMREAQGE